MKDIEKALDILEVEQGVAELDISNGDGGIHSEEFVFAVKVAIQAIKKQISEKITHEATLPRSCTCPTCNNVVDKFEKIGSLSVRITYQHCHFCGQKLDWSDGI